MIEETFLVEIGTEELPPKNLLVIAKSFKNNFINEINKKEITYKKIKYFASPRRLALQVIGLCFIKENKTIQYFKSIISIIILNSLKKISVTNFMKWGNIDEQKFIRPVNNITMLFGNKLISGKLFGIKSTRLIFGHRFMTKKSMLSLCHANFYEDVLLKQGKVIVDYKARKNKIIQGIKSVIPIKKCNVNINENVLEEVNSLVEWPVVISACFKEKFLVLPKEVLVFIMEKYQKYFPVYKKNNTLISTFIFVSNIETQNKEQIIQGNENVLNARFSDVKYFFDMDTKNSLEYYLPFLKNIIFHKKLGNMYDKTKRIQDLSAWIARKINSNVHYSLRAALLSKCDLMTSMVREFTDMQGIIGMHYARLSGEPEEVSIAIYEQYKPHDYKDKIPYNVISCILSISEKIDTIVGFFGSDDKHATGDSDPFGIRRISLSIMRILIKRNLSLNLSGLIKKSISIYNSSQNKLKNVNILPKITDFMYTRLLNWYKYKGYSIDIIKSIICKDNFIDFDKRIKAVKSFCCLSEAVNLFIINKRICNILYKSQDSPLKQIDNNILYEKEEIILATCIKQIEIKIKKLISESFYIEALLELVKIDSSLNNFFKNIMINVNDNKIRSNRITMIFKIREMILSIFDASYIKINR